ncbi:MAG: CoA transferase [Halioglobus sp.]|nr:CoA transferase [Halioglobus sp.]
MSEKPAATWQPLSGLTIIDFSMLLPGPLTTLIFADLGADVIKVEPPSGDYARGMGSHLFQGANRNKRSLVLDLKSPRAHVVVERLACHGDVVIEGFRPQVAERLGIGARTLQTINPQLIYCSISGFGQTGPMRHHPGHDLAYLAMAGSLSQSGHWREPSRRSSTPVADMAGGHHAAIAILAALWNREKDSVAPVIDISLYESMLYMNAIRFGFEQDEPTRDHLYPTNDLFTTRDGEQIALTIVEEKFWHNFVQAVGALHPEFQAEVYNTEAGRRRQGDKLMAELDGLFASNTAEHWLSLFEANDVPATLCISTGQALRTAQSLSRAMHLNTAHGPVLPFTALVSGCRTHANQSAPPAAGEHSEAVLGELGFDSTDIHRLVADGAIVTSQE